MDTLPERKDLFEALLSIFMSEEEREQFADPDKAVKLIEKGQPSWQALVCIASFTALLLMARQEGVEQARLEDLRAYLGGVVSKLLEVYESLLPKPSHRPLADEEARVIFHSRLALGLLLKVTGDEERAKRILREMAATKMASRGATFSSEGLQYRDVELGKWLAAVSLHDTYAKKEDYEMALYLITEAIACNPWARSFVKSVPALLDSWAEKCERSHLFDNWVDLFDGSANIIEVCGQADPSGRLPSECETTSPQFLTWEFGQLVARFAIQFGLPSGFTGQLLPDGFLGSADWGNGTVVASLLSEYGQHRNWQVLRQQYVSVWQSCYSYQWVSLTEIGPSADLYWAMRIGFADKILEYTTQQPTVATPIGSQFVSPDIETIKNIVTTVALRQLREQKNLGTILERLPPSKKEIRLFLEQYLREVWGEIPTKLVDSLAKAENYYRSEVNNEDAKVWFAKSVEASLAVCLVDPLVHYMDRLGQHQIAVCFPPPRGQERKTPRALGRLSLLEWADILDTLTVPRSKGLATLGAKELEIFMRSHLGGSRLPDLRPLAQSLRLVQQYRSGSAHYQQATSRYEKEKWELEQMRALILGIGKPSIIVQIFRLLTPRISPNSLSPSQP